MLRLPFLFSAMPVMESLAANDETLGAENTGIVDQPETGARPNIRVGGLAQNQAQPSGGNQSTSAQTQRVAPLRRVKSFYTPYMEDRLLRRLKFFFMGPHEKIKAKRKCPWKLIIQVLKILLVTIQVLKF